MQLNFVSARGDVLPLVNNKYFSFTADGLTVANTSLSSNVVGGVDGDSVNNVQAQPRGIILYLEIKSGVDVEEAKREILKVVKLKQYGALIWEYKQRTVTISGIVESVEMPRFTNKSIMQISLYCSKPFWEDVNYIVSQISEAVDLHYFTENNADMLYFPADGIAFGEIDTIRTKNFYNSGDVAVGLEITIVALDTVTNPIIYDQNGNYFGIGYEEESAINNPNLGSAAFSRPFKMKTGDIVVITTHKGNKTVTFNGVSVLDLVKPRSTWLQLATGDNTFSINSDDKSITNMNFNIKYKRVFI